MRVWPASRTKNIAMTTVILASGPSLTREDSELARAHADTLIAVNRSYELSQPDILALDNPMMLRDWYWPNEVNSSVMVIPAESKDRVWREWIKSPRIHMQRHRRKGDQEFIGKHFDAGRIQDELPGQCVSWKVHVADRSFSHRSEGDGTVPYNTRIICGHGKPRVWSMDIEGVPPFNRSVVA